MPIPESDPDQVFEQWECRLESRDKSWDYVQSNFQELFDDLKLAGLNSTDARKYMDKAIKAHNPKPSLIKHKYKQGKMTGRITVTEKEYEENWLEGIAKKAKAAFYDVYPQPTAQRTPKAQVTLTKKNSTQDIEMLEFEDEDESLTLE